jgi:hypothetical protein
MVPGDLNLSQSLNGFYKKSFYFISFQRIVHLLFIAGEDFELTEREKILVEGIHSTS